MWPFETKNKMISGGGEEIALKQGWNEKEKLFWIQITDRKTGITIRKYLNEEYYQNFHNMGTFTYKQTKHDEGEFD